MTTLNAQMESLFLLAPAWASYFALVAVSEVYWAASLVRQAHRIDRYVRRI